MNGDSRGTWEAVGSPDTRQENLSPNHWNRNYTKNCRGLTSLSKTPGERKLTLTTVYLLHNSSSLVGSVAIAGSSNPSCSSSFQLSPPCSRPSAGHLHGVHGEAALPSRFLPLFPTSAPLLSPGSGCFTTKTHHWSHGALSSPGRPSVQSSAASTLPCAGLLPTSIYIGSRFSSTWKNVFSWTRFILQLFFTFLYQTNFRKL